MVCGQGGIGSHLTFFLSRTGANLVTVDYDVVEDHNLAGQLYGVEDIGKKKVEAMVAVISRLCGESSVIPIDEEITKTKGGWSSYMNGCDVVCTSFDSIAARKLVYEHWVKGGKENSLFVDGRMSIENGQVFTVNHGNEVEMKQYESTFFDDSEVPEAPCTLKATTHCGSMIASLMTAHITNWFNNKNEKVLPREVCTQLDFNLPLMMFENVKPKAICPQ